MNEHNHTKLTSLRHLEPQRRQIISPLRFSQGSTAKSHAHKSHLCPIRKGESILQNTLTDKGYSCNTLHYEKDFTTHPRKSDRLKVHWLSKSKGFGSFATTRTNMPNQPSRSPSPEKKIAMLRTLRTPNVSRKSPVRKCKDVTTIRPQAAATAATQAWGTRGSFAMVDSKCGGSTHNYIENVISAHGKATRYRPYRATPTQSLEDVRCTSRKPGMLRKSIDLRQCQTNSDNTHGDDDVNIFLESCDTQGPGNHNLKIMSTKEDTMTNSRDTGTHGQPRPASAPTNKSGAKVTHGRGIKDHIPEKTCSDPNLKLYTKQGVGYENKPEVEHRPYKENPMNTSTIGSPNEENLMKELHDNCLDWKRRSHGLLQNLPPGIDQNAAAQVLNEVIVKGDKVRWSDIAGLDYAKGTLKEAVVYPFLRPDLFIGLREPARGLLLFGPPGTGKTMLARAVATESKSTFFSISSSSLTSKYHGDSEKLVRALFAMARELAPSVIFVDEIDSLLSARSATGEHEASRRMKTEFLIQWSAMAKAVVGQEAASNADVGAEAQRVLILAATNLPWAIDAAARRRFVRRQYIPLPEAQVRRVHLRMLLHCQKHDLDELALEKLSELTEGYSGSDLTELAKDAAMGPLRSVGDKLLKMEKDDIRPIHFADFVESLKKIKPSVSGESLTQYDTWAKDYGERGG